MRGHSSWRNDCSEALLSPAEEEAVLDESKVSDETGLDEAMDEAAPAEMGSACCMTARKSMLTPKIAAVAIRIVKTEYSAFFNIIHHPLFSIYLRC